jgi:hydrogenase maturation protease
VTEPAAPRKILVACVGNRDRGDDGIGPLVARKLEGQLPGHVPLVVRHSDILALVEDFAGCDALICVDASAPMGMPGRIRRIDLANEELPRELLAASTHGFGLTDAIELARALDRAPGTIVIYAVEAACFDGGAAMTQAVAEAAGEAARLVAGEAGRLSSSESC